MKIIDSPQNPLYKKLLSASSPHGARKQHLILIEGTRHVLDALDSGAAVRAVFFQNDAAGAKAVDAFSEKYAGRTGEERVFPFPVVRLHPSLFQRASQMKSPQGVMALAEPVVREVRSFLELVAGGPAKLLFLEDVQDPGNVGTLIRTADAFHFSGVMLTASSAGVWNPKTAASAMGSLFHIPVVLCGDTEETLRLLKTEGFTVYAAALGGEVLSDQMFSEDRSVILLGNEGNGLTPAAMRLSDRTVRIPMKGSAESLNVAAAGAVLCWEASGKFQR